MPNSQLPTPNSRIFLAGFPGDVGGANTEIWHTLKLWRSLGLRVSVLPTWGVAEQADYGRWAVKLAGIGCRIVSCPSPPILPRVDGLAGSIVVSFCNTRFVRETHRFRALGCKLVYAPCMTAWAPIEKLIAAGNGPFDRYVFQSEYQRGELEPFLVANTGYTPDRGRLIRGAFDLAEFPFQYRTPTDSPIIGRISRAHPSKFPANLWHTLFEIRKSSSKNAYCWVLGLGPDAERKCGPPPDWARVFTAGELSPWDFYSYCHVLLQTTDPAGPAENWPRVGLEAMAAGVPIVADLKGGWTEMISDAYNGFLVDVKTPAEAVAAVARLLSQPALHYSTAHNARRTVEAHSDPAAIGRAWLNLFSELKGPCNERTKRSRP